MPLHSHSARNASSSLVFSFQDLNSNPIGSPDTAGGRVSLSPKDIHGWMRGADISPSVTTFSLALEEVLPPLAVTSDPRPFNQQLPEPPDPRCVLEPQDNPEVAPAPVCALCCCFGIIYCCFAGSYWGFGQPWGPLGPWPSGSSCLGNMEAIPVRYFQSLQECQLGPGPQATAPYAVLDLDSDCGSTVPLT
ncbi:uncharacterized protein [Macaca nemestrina]|uniref:uncharacterized protein isoform X6 n=1 Tax=Macaca nemestrina TaxID=9545 RepID=UPI0039B982E8